MNIKIAIFSFVFILFTAISYSQTTTGTGYEKGRFFAYWGWNRETFSTSNIHFRGADYDFTLDKVVAHDRQTDFGIEYFNPLRISNPQYNWRVGYMISDHFSISIGWDHMKYVVDSLQTVKMNGYINNTSYSNADQVLTTDFLQFEHTNGLNYINTEIRRFDQLLGVKNFAINLTEGVGVGILYPKTDVVLMSKPENDQWHLSGYGVSAVLGINFTFWKRVFIQPEFKGGYINMPNIVTTNSSSDEAKQKFYFSQYNIVFGWNFKLGSSGKEN
jgi:3-isopropylmalate dehydratase small subunit